MKRTLLNQTVCPLLATIDQFNGLAVALIITREFDGLRDAGEEYTHKLTEADSIVTSYRYYLTIHDFVMLNILRENSCC